MEALPLGGRRNKRPPATLDAMPDEYSAESLSAGARKVGKAAVSSVRAQLAERLAVLRPDWHLPHSADALERYLGREVDLRPSLLRELGLSAVQILSAHRGEEMRAIGTQTKLAIAFTDLVDFTAYTEAEGDFAASELLRHQAKTVRPIVKHHAGKIVKHLGDGLLLTFVDPSSATRCVLDLVDHSPSPLLMRAGIHWGEPVVTKQDVIGRDVNLAARVADSTRAREVLATKALCDEVVPLAGVDFGEPLERVLPGIEEPVFVRLAQRAAEQG